MSVLINKLKKLINSEYFNDIDFESVIDDTLSFNENIELLKEKYNYAFKTDKILDYKPPKLRKIDILPQILDLHYVKRMAYFGGRIELFKRGLLNDIYHYDINSAYPWAMTKIPDLRGKWNYLSDTTENDLCGGLFGIVKAECIEGSSIIGAFPFRLSSGYVIYPQKCTCYYHICEVVEAINKGYKIKLGESWLLETPHSYPFRDYINQLMIKRLHYKENGDFAHIPLKLGANSFYGKLAQKPTMSKNKYREPKYRDLLMAGFITAHTRAQLLKYCDPNSTVLMATDGLYSTVPLSCSIGKGLGDWEYTYHDSGIFILAGIYALNNKGVWVNKIRGFRNLDIDALWKYIQKYPYDPIPLKDRRFLGIKYCLGLTHKAKEYKMCNFVDIPREIDWNNNRKRIFLPNGDSYSNNDTNNQDVSAIYKDKLLSQITDIFSEDSALSECD